MGEKAALWLWSRHVYAAMFDRVVFGEWVRMTRRGARLQFTLHGVKEKR